jgi:predicted acylesterase/phospholipase RssA
MLKPSWRGLALVLLAVSVVACSTVRRDPLPADDPLMQPSPSLDQGLYRFFELNYGVRVDALALSGGGQNGAYGVGMIKGWRERGIPRFGIVTGVSTGALVASHVFLDSAEADAVMERFYTHIKRSDVLCERNALIALTSDAFMSMAALEGMIETVISNEVIDEVAKQTEGGKRLLLIGTVNLDTGGYRMWDVGAMARAKQYIKYRAVLRASAGPPVAVPPVYLEGGMHCDGGTASSVFIPFSHDIMSEADQVRLTASAKAQGKTPLKAGTLHVIVNGLREPPTEHMAPDLLDIAARALNIQGYSMRLGNLWYIYERLRELSGQFRLRFLPDSLREDAKDFLAFDQRKMQRIFDQGVLDGRNPNIWLKEPPALKADH